jgi:hypothetical protein
VQTFVFARVLPVDRFAMFILVGTFGISLWLLDFGIAKILFVRLRAWHLRERQEAQSETPLAAQAGSIALVYGFLVALGTLVCFLAARDLASFTTIEALQFAAFFTFSALNLVWLVLRNVAVAVDEYIAFEALEAVRRVGHMGVMAAMLVGLPFDTFLVVANLLWAVLLVAAVRRLRARGAIALRVRQLHSVLMDFFKSNGREIAGSGTYAACELYIYNFPYMLWPLALGLGAPTVILDTSFKIVRGSGLLYAAGCDLMVPQQTRAFAVRDPALLTRATVIAASLCAVPALVLIVLLLVAGDRFFAFLLGPAATMPSAMMPLIIALLCANLVQTVSNYVLLHTGHFRELGRLAFALAVAMTLGTLCGYLTNADIVGYARIYTAVYAAGAMLYLALAIRGPLRAGRSDVPAPLPAAP